jgi:hypothetical protein
MFKPSILCRFAICRRVVMVLALWMLLVLGANEMRRAAQGDSEVYSEIKRLAVYSLAMRANR